MSDKTITLNPGYEIASATNPLNLKLPPLYHQQRTYDSLQKNDLVINTHNTGTGKTVASLLKLFDLNRENVLFIAPTNELIHQHAQDIGRFVTANELDFHVVEVTGKTLRDLELVDETGYTLRNPKKLHLLIENPRQFFPEMVRKQPLVMVTNPDLFYYCFYMAYSKLDAQNLFRDFIIKFEYMVVDEFHYYNAKQMANFLTFFAISKSLGYFDGKRKVCLLSATPDPKIITFLDRLGISYQLISPDNEPPSGQNYQRIQVLSEMELTIHRVSRNCRLSDSLSPDELHSLVEQNLDGVVISNSLRTISEVKQQLDASPLRSKYGLITGPTSPAERSEATYFPLILATPTVDIGYNFKRDHKARQNIDAVYFEANYAAEFLQRLGRAGRLLGKMEQNTPSRGKAFIKSSLNLEQDRYDRGEFADFLRLALPANNQFYAYIDSYAIVEAFQILYQLFGATSEAESDFLRDTFDLIKDIFAPDSDFDFDQLMKKFGWYRTFEAVSDPTNSYTNADDYTKNQWKKATWGYLKQLSWITDQQEVFEGMSEKLLDQKIHELLQLSPTRKQITNHAEAECHLMKSLFQFRNSELGFRCGVYDPNHLFQNQSQSTVYDLLYILQNCEFNLIQQQQFHQLTGQWGNDCDFYVRVKGLKRPRHYIKFSYQIEDQMFASRERFEKAFCFRPVALKNIDLGLACGELDQYVPYEINSAFKERYVTGLISKLENRYVLNSILETKRSFSYDLDVNFVAEGKTKTYQMIVGTEAYLIHAELKKKQKEKLAQNAD